MSDSSLEHIQQLDPVPDPTSERYRNRDLSSLAEIQLVRELAWLRVRNYLLASDWHYQREVEVSSELYRRRQIRKVTGRGSDRT